MITIARTNIYAPEWARSERKTHLWISVDLELWTNYFHLSRNCNETKLLLLLSLLLYNLSAILLLFPFKFTIDKIIFTQFYNYLSNKKNIQLYLKHMICNVKGAQQIRHSVYIFIMKLRVIFLLCSNVVVLLSFQIKLPLLFHNFYFYRIHTLIHKHTHLRCNFILMQFNMRGGLKREMIFSCSSKKKIVSSFMKMSLYRP